MASATSRLTGGAPAIGVLAIAAVAIGALAAGCQLARPPRAGGEVPLPAVHTGPATPAPRPSALSVRNPADPWLAGTEPVTVRFSTPLAAATTRPTITPAVGGRWSRPAPDELTFHPDAPWIPAQTETVVIATATRAADGASLAAARTLTYHVQAGSPLRLEQVLAQLGYLPLSWTPTSPTESISDFTAAAGAFHWRWPQIPATLAAQWSPGAAGPLLRGAVMAFEAHEGMAVDGVAGPQVWTAIRTAETAPAPARNTAGYTYALATKALPETLTVWHNGVVVERSRVNTGIGAAPTPDGTWPVYERLRAQVMRGTNPDGTHYADPVQWVAYFYGGDAVHYLPRARYGSPQSLGCLEVSYGVGAKVWPYLTYGSLVTVS